MGVYIKGMKMPKNCEQCPCSDLYGCAVLSQIMATKEMKSGRPDWCPLVEIKEPHGDLIDSDKLLKATVLNPVHVPYITIRDVKGMTAVIKAEGGK